MFTVGQEVTLDLSVENPGISEDQHGKKAIIVFAPPVEEELVANWREYGEEPEYSVYVQGNPFPWAVRVSIAEQVMKPAQ